MPKTHEDQIADYYEILHVKFITGRLEEAKFERLADKLDEWAAYAERKGATE